MTTLAEPASDTAAQPAGDDPGDLTIAPSVLRKIAEHAADQVPGTAKVSRKVAGVELGEHGATAKVSVDGDDVDLVLDLALYYPAPVRDVVRAVRAEVTDQLRELAAHRVRSMKVTVSALLPERRRCPVR